MSDPTQYVPINWEIIKSPVNWFTITLMLVIFSFVVHLALQYHNSQKGI